MLGFICVMLFGGILYAGLHPFHSPDNQVTWIAGAHAVRLGEYGTLLSSRAFPAPLHGGAERSLEFWVKPGKLEDSSTLIAFYSPDTPRQLSLSQSESDLEIHIESSDAWRSVKSEKTYVDYAFRDGKSALWAVTFSAAGTAVYRDGVFIKRAPVRPWGSEISGQLVVGNAPIFSDGWQGVLGGLAIYDTALDPGQIERHFSSWTRGPAPTLTADDSCIALYLFNEHAGRVVHNNAGSENDLTIPQKYLVLHQTLLDPAWRAFEWRLGFWQDAFINVGGLIPFGFFFCAYFSARGLRGPALRASALGAAVSIFIEVTQSHLPTRDSSMADVINNILGTVLGAVAYRGAIASTFDRLMAWIVGEVNGFPS